MRIRSLVTLGTFTLALAFFCPTPAVAAEVMCDPVMSPWDAAALQPIIEEAGGTFTDWDGVATAFGGSVVATNRALDTKVRGILAHAASTSSNRP